MIRTGLLDQARALADFSTAVESSAELQEAADVAVRHISLLMPGAGVSVMVLQRRRLQPAAASVLSLTAMDSAQMTMQEGPAIDTTSGEQIAVLAEDLTAESRWPRWTAIAVHNGWHTVLCTRLTTRKGHPLGVLTITRPVARTLQPADVDLATLLSTHLSVALETVQIRENLQRAINTNGDIGAAVGMLMERFGVDEDQAFTVLRRYSQDLQMKLHDVATQLVETGQLPAGARPAHRAGWQVRVVPPAHLPGPLPAPMRAATPAD